VGAGARRKYNPEGRSAAVMGAVAAGGLSCGRSTMMYRTMLRNGLTALALAAGLGLLATGISADEPAKADEKGFVPLFNGKDLEGWKLIVQGKADPEKTFTVKDGVIDVSGNPNGYFYTDKSYKNYVLRFEWRYPKQAGNSGCLVHIQPPQRVWPKCVEVQGLYNDHGHIFAIGGAKGKYSLDKDAQRKALKPHQEWNTTEVISKDGRLTSKINGIQVADGTGDLMEGPIGFQSEGAQIQFKNLRIKVME
jgi:hypothetical protein